MVPIQIWLWTLLFGLSFEIFFSMQVWPSRYKCGSENKNVGRSRLPKLQLVKEPVFVVLVSVKTLIDSITTTQKAETDTTVKNEPKQITPNGFVTASWNPAGIEYNRFSRNKSQNRILIRTGGLYRCVWGLYLRPRGWVFTSFSFWQVDPPRNSRFTVIKLHVAISS